MKTKNYFVILFMTFLPQLGQAAEADILAEKRLVAMAEQFDQRVNQLSMVLQEPSADNYLKKVLQRLFPKEHVHFKVVILRQSALNAFALPNGNLYVHSGLLARLENEAQLAAILAHEAAHVLAKHGLRQRSQAEDARKWHDLFALTGLPMIGDLVTASSMAGYSRDHEREADREAHKRLKSAGYDVHEAASVFTLLRYYVEKADQREPFFLASHPRLLERIETFQALNAGAQRGFVGAEAFLSATQSARETAMSAELMFWVPQTVLPIFERPQAEQRWVTKYRLFYAEALRQREGVGDLEKAEMLLREHLNTNAADAAAHLALAKVLDRRGMSAKASDYFVDYLRLAQGDDPARALAKAYVDANP